MIRRSLTTLCCLSADPEDYSSAKRYNVTFSQTTFTDRDYPAPFTLSSPITINIMDDGIAEGVEYFRVRIVETSDRFRVRIGQDTINVTITDSKSYISLYRWVDTFSPKNFFMHVII